MAQNKRAAKSRAHLKDLNQVQELKQISLHKFNGGTGSSGTGRNKTKQTEKHILRVLGSRL